MTGILAPLVIPLPADGKVSENNERTVKDPIVFGTAQNFENKAALVLNAEDFENPDLTVANPDSMPTLTYEQVVRKAGKFLDGLSEEIGSTNQIKEDFFSGLEKAGKFALFEEIIRSFSKLSKEDLAKLNESYLLPYASKIAPKNRKKDFPEGYTTKKKVAINALRWAGVYIWTSKEPPSFSELLKKIL